MGWIDVEKTLPRPIVFRMTSRKAQKYCVQAHEHLTPKKNNGKARLHYTPWRRREFYLKYHGVDDMDENGVIKGTHCGR